MSRLWAVGAGLVVAAVAVAAFFASGGVGGGGGGPGARLERWVTTSGVAGDVGTLEGDGARVRLVVSRHRGSGALRTICAAMANDAQTANGQLPSPDTEVTQLLARAYGLEYDAAQACYRAGTNGRTLLARSAADRTRAHLLFDRAIRRIDAVTGRSVTTTTTFTPPVAGTGFG